LWIVVPQTLYLRKLKIKGFGPGSIKGGCSVGRLGLTLIAHHTRSAAAPFVDPLAPLDLTGTDGLVVVGSSAPPLANLLRCQTVATRSYSSVPLPLFLGRSPARPGRRVT
jgi:hypothetical protein